MASHNASMLPYTKCVQYPDRCDPEVVRDYMVPLQQLYVDEYSASLQHRPHGGGFYHIQKYLVAPERMPEDLVWFKWESYVTWLSGFAMLVLVYYQF